MTRTAFIFAAMLATAAAAQIPLKSDGAEVLHNASWSVSVNGSDIVGTGNAQRDGLDIAWGKQAVGSRTAVIVELNITNKSPHDLNITQLEPLRAECSLAGVSKCLTNGYIYYDSGRLLDFGADKARKVESFWNATFYQANPQRALVIGYLNNDFAEGRIIAERKVDQSGFSIVARSLLHHNFVLKPGASISSGKVLIDVGDNPWNALEHYADFMKPQRKLNPVIKGWCSWFVYYGGVSESEVLKNAQFIARELKPYGMEWVQIDDGFYRAFGDWEGNDRFPLGMKHTAEEIRKLGLRPGLWLAPYAISEAAPIAKEHPEWLAHDEKGELQRIEPAHAGQAQLILDITHPDAQQWLSKLLHTVTDEWGYDFIKTDFVEWTLLAQQKFHNPTISKAQAYRLGDQIMRDAMGPSRHFLDCGPGNEAIGLIDSMRIGLDRPDDLPKFDLWQQYYGAPNATGPSIAKRYFFHNRTWINDPDHLRLKKLELPQAQAAASLVALSGGTTISGDKLYELDADRLNILKKVLPSYGQAARPLDLFTNPQPQIFALPIHSAAGDWTIAAAFNAGDGRIDRTIDFAAAGLDPQATYLVYDVWSQKLLTETAKSFSAPLGPRSVCCVALRKKTGTPQVLGTDRHIMQGAIELQNVRWDDAANTITGTALGNPGMSWTIAIYLPQGYRLPVGDRSDTYMDDAGVLHVRVRFDGAGTSKDWSVQLLKT